MASHKTGLVTTLGSSATSPAPRVSLKSGQGCRSPAKPGKVRAGSQGAWPSVLGTPSSGCSWWLFKLLSPSSCHLSTSNPPCPSFTCCYPLCPHLPQSSLFFLCLDLESPGPSWLPHSRPHRPHRPVAPALVGSFVTALPMGSPRPPQCFLQLFHVTS